MKKSTKFVPLYQYIKEQNKDRIENIALIDENHKYSYKKMFRLWDAYAEVFSGLGITGKNNSRVCLLENSTIEELNTVFACNMVGTTISAFGSFELAFIDSIIDSFKGEKLTDLVALDYLVNPSIIKKFLDRKEEIGLRNIIIIKNSLTLDAVSFKEKTIYDLNYMALKQIPGVLFMEDLLVEYEATPIEYYDKKDFDAFYFHTSGSTKGVRKALPFTNAQIISACKSNSTLPEFKKFEGNGVILGIGISHAHFFMSITLIPLTLGMTLLCNFCGLMSKKKYEMIEKYQVNACGFLPVEAFVIQKMPKKPDLSSIKLVFVGGNTYSSGDRKIINQTLSECGSKAKAMIGYGLSEVGGVVTITKPGDETDSIGFPMPDIEIKIQDEETKEFYDISDGERIGGLFVHSEHMTSGVLNGIKQIEKTTIDGKEYVCTNDLVQVNKDGSLTHRGRTNNFFVNNSGVRFEAGLVESAISKCNGIETCILRPAFNKTINDTVPFLFVETNDKENEEKIVKDALFEVFVKQDLFKKSNLPTRVIIVDKIAKNVLGKIDKYALSVNSVGTKNLNIQPIIKNDKLIDVVLLPLPMIGNAAFIDVLPDEIAKSRKTDMLEKIDDPSFIFSFPPLLVFSEVLIVPIKSDKKLNKNPKGDNNMSENNNSNNSNKEFFPPFPPFFPPFHEFMKDAPWNKKEEGKEDENKECKWNGIPQFGFPPFMYGNKEEFKMPEFKKPELSAEQVEKILDKVQDVLGYFFDASKVDYTYEEDSKKE